MLTTIIGTVSHESGHYAVARSLGYASTISYAYTGWDDAATRPFIDSAFSKYALEITSNLEFPGKPAFDLIQQQQTKDGFWITVGGPVQTMLTGTIGLLLLLSQRRKILATNRLQLCQWCYLFLSLFWLRQVVNLVTWITRYYSNGKFSSNGDEIRLAMALKLPKEALIVPTALTGVAVLMFVIFRIIPIGQRITFITAGLAGGILGYVFWLDWIGPIVMP